MQDFSAPVQNSAPQEVWWTVQLSFPVGWTPQKETEPGLWLHSTVCSPQLVTKPPCTMWAKALPNAGTPEATLLNTTSSRVVSEGHPQQGHICGTQENYVHMAGLPRGWRMCPGTQQWMVWIAPKSLTDQVWISFPISKRIYMHIHNCIYAIYSNWYICTFYCSYAQRHQFYLTEIPLSHSGPFQTPVHAC